MESSEEQQPGSRVRIQLSTRDQTLNLPSLAPILVPTNVRRANLSELVNSQRTDGDKAPLQFLINGQFLRTTIDDYLTAHGISAETTLPVEIVRALLPPTYISSFEHDDWVSSVDVLPGTDTEAKLVSGSYDGILRVWHATQGTLLASSSSVGHSSSIKALRCLSNTRVVTGSSDRVVRVWKHSTEETLKPTLELYGHRSGVESIDVHAGSSRILSASADSAIALWSATAASAPEAPHSLLPSASLSTAKRRKRDREDVKTIPQRGALATMTGHSDVASAAVFKAVDATVAYSASWDHSLRTWDLTTAKQVDSKSTLHPLLCLTELASVHLLAAGSSARHITLIDPRASASKIAAMTLRGHGNAVVSLARDPGSEYAIVSGSHDGSCRVWDIRSVRPSGGAEGGQMGESLYVFHRESVGEEGRRAPEGGKGVKVFDVRWDAELGIVSAGEDKRVQINRPGVVKGPG